MRLAGRASMEHGKGFCLSQPMSNLEGESVIIRVHYTSNDRNTSALRTYLFRLKNMQIKFREKRAHAK